MTDPKPATDAETLIPLSDPVRTVRTQRRLDAEPYRVYRAWSAPEALSEWFPDRVEGSLTPGTRSTLVFPDQRVWWDVIEADPEQPLPVSLAVAGR